MSSTRKQLSFCIMPKQTHDMANTVGTPQAYEKRAYVQRTDWIWVKTVFLFIVFLYFGLRFVVKTCHKRQDNMRAYELFAIKSQFDPFANNTQIEIASLNNAYHTTIDHKIINNLIKIILQNEF